MPRQLSGVKRTRSLSIVAVANDPKRTLAQLERQPISPSCRICYIGWLSEPQAAKRSLYPRIYLHRHCNTDEIIIKWGVRVGVKMRSSKQYLSSVVVVAASLITLGALPSRADTYNYTGNDYTNVVSCGAPCSGPFYTTSMKVMGDFVISTLADDLTLQIVTPTSFSFNDGVQTLTNLNSTGQFQITTNGSGVPTNWLILVELIGDTSDYIELSGPLEFNNDEVAQSQYGMCGPDQCYAYNDSAGSFNDVASTTPLPAALPLFATGLGAMGLFGWRRKRKNAALLAA
jgi:hypothetical protein